MTERFEGLDLTGRAVTNILVDLDNKTVLLSAKDEPVAMVRLAPEGLIFHAVAHRLQPPTPEATQDRPPSESVQTGSSGPTETEKEKPQTLQGKLKSKPKPGRPDRTGKPTAWARFAAHEEGQESAHMYSTTFHRQTAETALSLDKDASLTVQGYPHVNDDPDSKRMDTLSVINLLDYPGKPKRQ